MRRFKIDGKYYLVCLVIGGIFGMQIYSSKMEKTFTPVGYDRFIGASTNGEIIEVHVNSDGRGLKYSTKTASYSTIAPSDVSNVVDSLAKKGVTVTADAPRVVNNHSILTTILISIIPVLVLVFFLYKFGNKGQVAQRKFIGISPSVNVIRFSDVVMNDAEFDEVMDVVDYLRNSTKYVAAGAKFPKGILLSGPPGTGKTLLAKAIAGEVGTTIFAVSGSEFVDTYVGVGAKRVRDLFEEARASAPSMIFIDEIDAVGSARGSNSHSERDQTLNQLLVEMDGFSPNSGVLILAATNRVDMLDAALTRPGRFDRAINFSLPDLDGRNRILNLAAKGVKVSNAVNFLDIAKGTTGFSGAELGKLITEAAFSSVRNGNGVVTEVELNYAKDKVSMGATRALTMSDAERTNTAFHEAGHAMIGYLSPEHDKLCKVSIVPRANALGVTQFQPDAEVFSHSKLKLIGVIKTLLAGRAAEEVMFGENSVTTGASSDLERATALAKSMVTKWGFGDIGLVTESSRTPLSAEFNRVVDENVKSMLASLYKEVVDTLNERKDELVAIKKLLIERETISISDVESIMSTNGDKA